MMDYLSDFPGPSKDAAIRCVIRMLRSDDSTTIRMDEHALYAIVSEEYDTMGPMGSQACWLAVTSNMLIANTKARLAQFCDISAKVVAVSNPDHQLMIGKHES
tara:strand:- start:156 stop:464 length:309 start_codon:yes stop_codon:yes gene_type:complete